MLKNLVYTITGGLGLLLSTILLNAFVSSPPSRAEFNKLKAGTTRHLLNIDSNLETIKEDQKMILEHLLRSRIYEKQIIKTSR